MSRLWHLTATTPARLVMLCYWVAALAGHWQIPFTPWPLIMLLAAVNFEGVLNNESHARIRAASGTAEEPTTKDD